MAVSARRMGRTVHPAQRVPLLNVGIIIFLASELMFFASLFGMYFTLRGQAHGLWPPPGTDLPFVRPLIFTIDLVASSFTMQMGVRAIKRGDVSAFRRWVVLTFVMGVVFLTGQGYDWMTANFHVATNAYGSAFYTMTGFHGLHVLAGLLVMLVILGRSAAGAYTAERHAAVEAATYYWHFVDVVWVGLFTVLFIIK